VPGPDGNFYGTTYQGGANGDGTVFKITREGTVETLHSFDATDGAFPYAGLVLGADGSSYGTTIAGGANEAYGTVFKLNRDGTLETLHSFDGTDGEYPLGGLVPGPDGSFYGTTAQGGGNGYGTVFKITREGRFETLHNFENTDGAYPYAGLLRGADGTFYGTTFRGGANGFGAVYSVRVPAHERGWPDGE
jgi:uncharacterized repeat protein (TIGR03803 family)